MTSDEKSIIKTASQLELKLKECPVNTIDILDSLLDLNKDERMKVKKHWDTYKSQDLFNRIESVCKHEHGMVAHLLKALCIRNVHHFMASELWKVYRNSNPIFNPHLDAYTDIICTATYEDIQSIINELINLEKLNNENNKTKILLEKYIQKVSTITKPNYQAFLVALSNNQRSNDVNEDAVYDQAQKLYEAGEGKIGTDEKTFIRIFSEESYEQLRRIFDEYPNHSKNQWSIEKAIKSETSGDFKAALLAVVQVTRDRVLYFVERFHDAERDYFYMIWTRMIIMNSSNMNEFKQKFFDRYGKTLEQYIKDNCNGTGEEINFKTQLLRLIEQYNI